MLQAIIKKKSNVKFAIITLYTLLIACMGLTTIVENFYGTQWAGNHIYGAWWFITLWGAVAAFSLIYLFKNKVHRRLPVMLLHISLLVILCGAFISHYCGVEGELHLRKGDAATSFTSSDAQQHSLPFALTLSHFDLNYYPGTDAIMDYNAHVVAHVNGDSITTHISMNNIAKIKGYRFYQSAYDSDLNGTTLLVAHDPVGIAVTYLGYLLLFISFMWCLFSKHTRISHLYRMATRRSVAILLFALGATSCFASEVNSDIADDMGEVAVLYNGRICPLNTAATQFVTKLCGKSQWNGLSANEIFLSWTIFYSEWETRKIILVKNDKVRQLLGVEGKYASVRDFYTSQHEYKLKNLLSDSSIDSSTRKAIRETDEKIQVITMFYNSEMLKIFPLECDGTLKWYTPGSTELPQATPMAEFQFINHAMDHLVKHILDGNINGAKNIIAKIKLYQREKAHEVLPSTSVLKAEIIYNALQASRWHVYLFLTCSFILCFIYFGTGHNKWVKNALIILAFIMGINLTALLALRWVVSGHVPLSNGLETMLFMAWITVVLTFATIKKMPSLLPFGPVVAALCMLVATIASGSPQITQLMPVLQSPLLSIHVVLVMIAYSIFAIISIIAIVCLCVIRHRNNDQLERLTALSQFLIYPAVALLAFGIFIGAVWANISWGAYWSWDPKETWALITLMIYAIPLHHNSFQWLNNPRRYHTFIAISFSAVLITYLGVNYFLSGMHSYA